jgi:hypothetical protein
MANGALCRKSAPFARSEKRTFKGKSVDAKEIDGLRKAGLQAE